MLAFAFIVSYQSKLSVSITLSLLKDQAIDTLFLLRMKDEIPGIKKE